MTVNGESEVGIIFLGKELDCVKNKPTTLNEFTKLLSNLDKLETCVGGPGSDLYKNIHPECAHRDGVTWRHKKCPIVMENGSVCSYCLSLYQKLPQNLERQTKAKLRVRVPGSPTTRNKVKRATRRGQVIKQRLTRKERKLEELQKELSEVQSRLSTMQESSFTDKLRIFSKDLPTNQVKTLKEYTEKTIFLNQT